MSPAELPLHLRVNNRKRGGKERRALARDGKAKVGWFVGWERQPKHNHPHAPTYHSAWERREAYLPSHAQGRVFLTQVPSLLIFTDSRCHRQMPI